MFSHHLFISSSLIFSLPFALCPPLFLLLYPFSSSYTLYPTTRAKVVVLSHSYGAQLFLYFCRWVVEPSANGGGGKSPEWVNDNVHAFLGIAGPYHGIPKTVTSLLSGEMKVMRNSLFFHAVLYQPVLTSLILL